MRVDFLQEIIDKEASASTYMYNYPPKQYKVDQQSKKGQRGVAIHNDGQKMKKMYDDRLNTQRNKYQAQITTLKTSMAHQIENLNSMFSSSSKQLVNLTTEHRNLQAKFKEYYDRSDKYIKDKEQKISESEAQIQQLKYDFSNFDERYGEIRQEV